RPSSSAVAVAARWAKALERARLAFGRREQARQERDEPRAPLGTPGLAQHAEGPPQLQVALECAPVLFELRDAGVRQVDADHVHRFVLLRDPVGCHPGYERGTRRSSAAGMVMRPQQGRMRVVLANES